jgi:hypothetical protein
LNHHVLSIASFFESPCAFHCLEGVGAKQSLGIRTIKHAKGDIPPNAIFKHPRYALLSLPQKKIEWKRIKQSKILASHCLGSGGTFLRVASAGHSVGG